MIAIIPRNFCARRNGPRMIHWLATKMMQFPILVARKIVFP
jgi:hypothetical protein